MTCDTFLSVFVLFFIGATIRTRQKSECLPYAGSFMTGDVASSSLVVFMFGVER